MLSGVRTVRAFEVEDKELQRYAKELDAAQEMGIKKSTALGGGEVYF